MASQERVGGDLIELELSEMSAADIDGSFMPRLRDEVGGVEVEGETVFLVEGTYKLHWLNRLATIVATCFDGRATLDELIEDFVDAFRADPDTIRDDILAITRQMGAAGLLVGVAEESPAGYVPHASLEEGTLVPGFSLPDLDGRFVDLEDLRGRRVLLVNWSDTCGFCRTIASELAELQPELQKQGAELVLVAHGQAEGNRELLQESGLECMTLVQTTPVEVFVGIGTPSAYLVDDELKIASKLAIGSVEVPALVRSSIGLDGRTPPA